MNWGKGGFHGPCWWWSSVPSVAGFIPSARAIWTWASPLLSAIFPGGSRPNRVDQNAHALVVGRVEPEHPVERALGLLESIEAPEAQSEAVHAAEERPVVDMAPRQQAIEGVAQGQVADAKPRLVVTDRVRRPVVEDDVAEGRVGVQAAEIGLAEVHQDLVRSLSVAGILEVVGLGDGIAVQIVGVPPGHDLLHFERLPRAAGDDRLGPLLIPEMTASTPGRLSISGSVARTRRSP